MISRIRIWTGFLIFGPGVGTPVNVPGLTGLPQTIEQLEAVLCTLPSARLFQLAEMKMRMEMTTVPGTMGGLMA